MFTNIDFNKILISLDTYTSYIPGLSTITNLVDLALKAIFRGKPTPEFSYRRYIQSKSVADCALLMIPVIGNILVPALNIPKKRGQYYERKKDMNRALAWYKRLPQNNVEAQFLVKKCSSILAIERGNYSEAFASLRDIDCTTVERKNEIATLLTQCADSGRLQANDTQTARELVIKLLTEAQRSSSQAKYALALIYRDGLGVQKNSAIALRYITEAAEEGNGPAQYCLGYMYEEGTDGVSKDIEKALGWYTKAAAQESPGAQEKLEELSHSQSLR